MTGLGDVHQLCSDKRGQFVLVKTFQLGGVLSELEVALLGARNLGKYFLVHSS